MKSYLFGQGPQWGWNYPDALFVGKGGMTLTEYQTMFTLWCIIKSPLMLGNDLRNMEETDEAYKVSKASHILKHNFYLLISWGWGAFLDHDFLRKNFITLKIISRENTLHSRKNYKFSRHYKNLPLQVFEPTLFWINSNLNLFDSFWLNLTPIWLNCECFLVFPTVHCLKISKKVSFEFSILSLI